MQQCNQKLLPVTLQSYFKKNADRRPQDDEDIQSYQTRNFDDFYIPLSRLSSVDKLPIMVFPRLWNNLRLNDIKILRNKLEFKSKLKVAMLNDLQNEVICDRLLCQACHPI